MTEDMRDFLELLRTGLGKSSLSQKIISKVENARAHEEWRVEYMTLYMRDRQNREEGREEGLREGRIREIVQSVQDGDYTAERGALKLGISLREFVKLINEERYVVPVDK